jgi:hypothetical protein
VAVFGVDYSWMPHPSIGDLRAAGVKFVCRYFSRDTTTKNLTAAEAKELTAAGIAIVCVWEHGKDRARAGRAAGVDDATEAAKQAKAVGMPADRPIFFAVDWDARSTEQAAINAYLDGAASVLGRARVGIYGGYGPVSRALDAGKAVWAWQTYGWSGMPTRWDDRAQLRQVKNGQELNGAAVDYDEARADDFGQWRVRPAMKLVSRKAWGARSPRADAEYLASTRGVKVHYTGDPENPRMADDHGLCDDRVRGIQNSHMDGNGWNDIGYSALVCPHGYVFVGRGPHHLPAANGPGLNTGHYAVCGLVGSKGLTVPSDAMLSGIRDAIEWLRRDGDAGNEIKGHRDGYSTDCPGAALYAWVRKGAPRPEGDDMPTAKEVAEAVWKADGLVEVPGADPKNPTWQARNVLTEVLTRQDRLEAKLDQVIAALAKGATP